LGENERSVVDDLGGLGRFSAARLPFGQRWRGGAHLAVGTRVRKDATGRSKRTTPPPMRHAPQCPRQLVLVAIAAKGYAVWAVSNRLALHHGRVVKRTSDGVLIEFRSVVDAVRCAIEVQNGMAERNGGLPPERRIELRVGIHVGDVVEESDGDLMGDGVNIAARLEGIAKPGSICLSEDAYRQAKSRLDLAVRDLGTTQLKNIAGAVYSVEVGKPASLRPVKAVRSLPPSYR
jgi:hypothetical protein